MSSEQQTPEPGRPLGRGMLITGWLIGLALLSLFFGGVLGYQHNPNRNINTKVGADGVREVVLQRNFNGHYVTSGKINGRQVEFMLDTGASDVSIPGNIAQQLGLKRGQPATYSTANGYITSYLTRIDRLSLGDIELHDIRASINPHMDDETILLGMSFLKHLEFTQRGDTLIIRQYP